MTAMPPQKILMISTSSGSRGGGEIAFMQQAEGLLAAGHQVQMLLSDDGRMDELVDQYRQTVPITRIPYRNTYDKRFRFLSEICLKKSQKTLIDRIRELSPDLIHLNKQNLEDGLDWMQAIEEVEIPSAVTIYVPNSMDSLKAKFGKVRDFLLRPQFRRLKSRLVVVSEASKRTLETFLGDDHGSKIKVIPTGVPAVEPVEGEPFRREWGLPDNAFVIGTVARIEVQKNPWFAIHLLAKLPPHVHLVWVGDGRLRGEIEKLAADLKVSDRLHIDGWKQDARDRLSAFDLFLLPSRYEGFPLAILEAMCSRRPCYVSDVDGNVESVIDGKTGRILPLDDLETWENTIVKDMDTPSMLREMGEAGRQRFLENYSLEAMTRDTIDLYAELLGEESLE